MGKVSLVIIPSRDSVCICNDSLPSFVTVRMCRWLAQISLKLKRLWVAVGAYMAESM